MIISRLISKLEIAGNNLAHDRIPYNDEQRHSNAQ